MTQNNSLSDSSNSTANKSSSTSLPLAISYTAILLVGIAGNVLVIRVIHTKRRLQSNYYLLVYHLAISDLLVLLTTTERTMYFWIPTFPLVSSSIACKLLPITGLLFYTSGVLFLVVIGLLRYRALFHPFAEPFSRRKLKIVVIAVYIASTVISPTHGLLYNYDNGHCVIPVRHKLLSIISGGLLFCVNFSIPVIILFVLYSRIIYHLWIEQRNLSDILESNIVSEDRARPSNTKFLNGARRRRCIVVSIVSFFVVVVFSVSSAPFEIMWLIDMIQQTGNVELPWWTFSTKLFGSCAVNPFIYGIGYASLRARCRRFFRTIREIFLK